MQLFLAFLAIILAVPINVGVKKKFIPTATSLMETPAPEVTTTEPQIDEQVNNSMANPTFPYCESEIADELNSTCTDPDNEIESDNKRRKLNEYESQDAAEILLSLGKDEDDSYSQATGLKLPSYKMSRTLINVPEVWQEYKYGLNGQPSLESLNTKYGKKWRNTNTESTHYCARNKIIQNILTNMEQGMTEQEAVNQLENYRLDKNLTIYQLQKNLVFRTWKPVGADAEFKMARGLRTIQDIWQEYKYGLNGHQSVESMDNKYGRKWRTSSVEVSMYCSRSGVYKKIRNMIRDGMSESDALQELEREMKEKNWTLSELNEKKGDEIEVPYRLSRNLQTVADVWQEYKRGLNGNPSIESLNTKFGNKWRNTRTETYYYQGRDKIYRKILEQIEKGATEEVAVALLEQHRIDNNWTVRQLQLSL